MTYGIMSSACKHASTSAPGANVRCTALNSSQERRRTGCEDMRPTKAKHAADAVPYAAPCPRLFCVKDVRMLVSRSSTDITTCASMTPSATTADARW